MSVKLKSYREIFNAMKATVDPALKGARVASRSAILTILHAAALQDAEQYIQIARVLDAFSLYSSSGDDLDRRALDYGVQRLPASVSRGEVKFGDSNYPTKVTGSLSVIALAGSVVLNLQSGEGNSWPSSAPFGVAILDPRGPNEEKVNVLNRAGDQLSISATTNSHAIGIVVTKGTSGVDRTFASGTQVYVPQVGSQEEILFETSETVVLYDGEVETDSADVVSLVTGEATVVGSGKINSIKSPSFSSASVTNSSSTSGGRDIENDEDFRDRIVSEIQELAKGTRSAILSGVLGLTSGNSTVTSASIEEPIGFGATNIWVDDGTGNLSFGTTSITQPESLILDADAGLTRGKFRNWPLVRGGSSTLSIHKDLERGTPTSVAVLNITDTSKSWVVNAYAGMEVVDSNGDFYRIVSNTSTSLTLTNVFSSPSTPDDGGYAIYNQATQLTIFDAKDLVTSSPSATDDIIVNYATGNVELNSLKYPTGMDARGALVTTTYQYATGLVQEVARKLNGDPTDFTNYPGLKAVGTYVEVDIPQTVTYSFSLSISVSRGKESDFASLVKDKVIQYVNGLGVGEDIILSEIIKRVKLIDGISDVKVNSPTSNPSVLYNQIPKTDTNSITVV